MKIGAVFRNNEKRIEIFYENSQTILCPPVTLDWYHNNNTHKIWTKRYLFTSCLSASKHDLTWKKFMQ